MFERLIQRDNILLSVMEGISEPGPGLPGPQSAKKHFANLCAVVNGTQEPSPYDSRSSTPDSASVDITSARYSGADTVLDLTAEADTGSDAEEAIQHVAAGRLPEEVYERTLTPWRAAVRRRLVQAVEWESRIIAAMQVRCQFRRHATCD